MEFSFFMPTKLIFGRDCVKKHRELLEKSGTKPLIVTGRKSASMNGSLEDITQVLEHAGIAYTHFNEVESNPSVSTIRKAAEIYRKEGCDYIIGIGGGSPLDAAKAIAVLAENDIDDSDLFSGKYKKKPAPIIAVPTTSGTGSEATQYSILTYDKIKNKKSIVSEDIFPAISFLDPKYTETLPLNTTINTAIDALSHSIEGYLSAKATDIVSPIALKSIEILGGCLRRLSGGEVPSKLDRDRLMYASMLAGIVIAHTSTTSVHAMGYPLTYYKNIDHGRANGLLLFEYINFLERTHPRVKEILTRMDMHKLEDFKELMDSLLGERETLSEDEILLFTETAKGAKNISNTAPYPGKEEIIEIYRKSLKTI